MPLLKALLLKNNYTATTMDVSPKKRKGELNMFIVILLVIFIIRHAYRLVFQFGMGFIAMLNASYYEAFAHCYNMVAGIILVWILILILLDKSKKSLYCFFGFQFINSITISLLSGGAVDAFIDSGIAFLVSCGVLSIILLLRKNGKSGWAVILGEPSNESAEEEVEKATVEQSLQEQPLNNAFPDCMEAFPAADSSVIDTSCLSPNTPGMTETREEKENNPVKGVDAPLAEEKLTLEGGTPSMAEEPIPNKKESGGAIHFFILSIIALSLLLILGALVHNKWNEPTARFSRANALFAKGQVNRALIMYENLASEFYAPAINRLGWLYLYNDSVPLDYEKGIKYMRLAGKTDENARTEVLRIYMGKTVKGQKFENRELAEVYCNECIKDGVSLASAYFFKGNLVSDKDDYKLAYYFWNKSAELGEPAAYCNLGWLFNYGKLGFYDYGKALHYFEKALENCSNEDYALYHIGHIYMYGLGVRVNRAKGEEYIKKAAQLGDKDAQREYAEIQLKK